MGEVFSFRRPSWPQKRHARGIGTCTGANQRRLTRQGYLRRASVPSVPKKLGHNELGVCESVPESVLASVPRQRATGHGTVPSVSKKLDHNGLGPCESVPESVLASVPDGGARTT